MANHGSIEAIAKKTGNINVIIETPKGSANKYKFDEETKLFKLSKSMPAGAVFPFDFGFIPSTLAPDGDPLDILVLMDEPVFVGCLMDVRLLGVIEAQQKPKGEKTRRNDRLIGVFAKSKNYGEYKSIFDLSNNFLSEVEHFFISYHRISGNIFRPIKRDGPAAAKRLVQESMRRFSEKR
ncbi:MAG: inorganic diphosphatase [Verrucomicrobiales bacterium]|nr:inorganic diphosphatase [Verrucomicrobiales bacterium]